MSVINFYEKMPKNLKNKSHNPHYEKHGIKLPFRMCIIGSSGSMKTNCCCSLIYSMPNTFEEIYLLTRNSDEPLYNLLKEKLRNAFKVYEELSEFPTLEEFKEDYKDCQRLIIFDDMVLNKDQKKMEEYFIRARKLNCSVIYISQSYFKTPKIIRQNINYCIFKKLSSMRDLNLIMSEYSLGKEKKDIEKMYLDATSDSLVNFFLIDIDTSPERKFRKNFNEIYE